MLQNRAPGTSAAMWDGVLSSNPLEERFRRVGAKLSPEEGSAKLSLVGCAKLSLEGGKSKPDEGRRREIPDAAETLKERDARQCEDHLSREHDICP